MDDFAQVHDRYLQSWATALATGEASEAEAFMAPGYHGWFAPASDHHVPFDRAQGAEGMRESVAALRGADFRVAHRTVCRRGDDEAVVSYEKRIERADEVVASAFIVEAWRMEEGQWVLCRELTEHGATLA